MREVVVIGALDGLSFSEDVAMRLSAKTRHSVLVRADAVDEAGRAGIRGVSLSTRFHQERRIARIDGARCSSCAHCLQVCVRGALRIGIDGIPRVDSSLCNGCGKCLDACERGSLTLSVMTEARCMVASTPAGRLVEAELTSEGRMSEGLVFALREEGRRQAKMVGADALWIDARMSSESLLQVAIAGADAVVVVAGVGAADRLPRVLQLVGGKVPRVEVLLVDGGDAPEWESNQEGSYVRMHRVGKGRSGFEDALTHLHEGIVSVTV